MASSDQRSGEPPSVASMRVKLKYVDVETFIEKFSSHITRNGIFIATKSVKPTGTVVRFELQLADGSKLLKGEGIVAWKREPDPENPGRPPGIGIRYSKLDAESRRLIERIAKFKAERGDSDGGGVPQAPLTYGESGPVATLAGAESGPVLTPMPEGFGAAAGVAAGAAKVHEAHPALPPVLAGDADEGALRAMIDDAEPALDEVLARARTIARAARGAEVGGGDDALLRQLEELARPGAAGTGVAEGSIEEASQALAGILGASAPAPARMHRPGAPVRSEASRSEEPPARGAKTAEAAEAAEAAERRPEAAAPVTTTIPEEHRTPTPEPIAASPPVRSRPGTLPPIGATSRARRTTPPPPPPSARRTPTAPPPPAAMVAPAEPALHDEITKQVNLSAIAEVDAALAAAEQEDVATDSFVASEASRMAPPSMLHNVLAPEDPTGLEIPAPAAPYPEGTDTALRAAAELGGFALEPSELDHLAPGGRRTRSYDDDAPPIASPEAVTAVAPDDDDGMPLDEGALLELDPDEDEDVETAGKPATPAPSPYDDLNAALDAALDVRLDSESDVSPAALAAAAGGGMEADDDGLDVDVDLEPSTAQAAPEPRQPASASQPPPDGGDLSNLGDEDIPRKKGFFSKIFKK